MWVLLFIRTVERINFVVENQGFERADGYGSPLAFSIGLIIEQFYFLPAFAVVIFGLKNIFEQNKTNTKA